MEYGEIIYRNFFDIDKIRKPYESLLEALDEWVRMIDLGVEYIKKRVEYSQENSEYDFFFPELSVEEDISAVLARSLQELETEEEPFFECVSKHIKGRVEHTEEVILAPVRTLKNKFQLSNLDFWALICCYACETDSKYEKYFMYLQDDEKNGRPKKGTIIALFRLWNVILEDEKILFLAGQGQLTKYLLQVDRMKNQNTRILLQDSLLLRKQVWLYLNGMYDTSMIADDSKLEALNIHGEQFKKLKHIQTTYDKESERIIINIYGPKKIGKKHLIQHVMKQAGKKIIPISLSELIRQNSNDWIEELRIRVFWAVVLDCPIMCTELESQDKEIQENLMHAYEEMKIVPKLYLISTKKLDKQYQNVCMIYIELPILDFSEKMEIWKHYAEKYSLAQDVCLEELASRFYVTPVDVKDIFLTAHYYASEDLQVIKMDDLLKAIQEHNVNHLGRNATLIKADYNWNDLILDEYEKNVLEMFCNNIELRTTALEQWGFDKKYPYGSGLSALFYGSPGTGKTMAAQVLANRLHLSIYRIDLSQMISKYIGETEKNMTELFQRAENINAILFFDEADSLFAKRSEVKDSHDKNANAETSHLLQLMESYRGVCILATNYLENIDEAFKRRIKFMVRFTIPDATTRLELYQSILPDKVPVGEELDFEFFAREFELSGSVIKDILFNAACMAIAEKMDLCNKHIVRAIYYHYQKMGQIIDKERFGYLSDCIT